MTVVVARYNEDVAWLAPAFPCVWLGNKGGAGAPPLPPGIQHVETLPNCGREAHTYLTYIVRHYEALPPVVVFTQGRLDDHRYAAWAAAEGLSPERMVARWVAEAASEGRSRSFNLAAHEVGEYSATPHFKIGGWRGDAFDSGMTLGQFYRSHVGAPLPPDAEWYEGANFAVTRERLRQWPLAFWVRLLEALPTGSPSCEQAHFFERMWALLVRPRMQGLYR